jgi:hypothetical protein
MVGALPVGPLHGAATAVPAKAAAIRTQSAPCLNFGMGYSSL